MMRFTWDENKRRATVEARGLDFAKAEEIFERPTFTWEDSRFQYRERRFLTLGLLGTTVVVVVHTETEDRIHVISMRKAENDEQELYFRNAGFYGS